ncbi:glycosyltransferase [Candidatus Peregrinibacteria bacterium]|nr:glycosyltransferase [Candidatus Peregrinibacteria bacterium]
MKVALVHDFLVRLGGAERVLKVLADMFPEAPIFTLFYDEKKIGNVFPKERIHSSSLQKYQKILHGKYRYLTFKFPKAIEDFNFEGFDLVISSSAAYSHGILTPLKTNHVCYCHSPMRYAWDWAGEYRKENNIQGLKTFFYAPLIRYLREWDIAACDRPTTYISNSHNVQNRLKKYYKINSDVIYPPVEIEKFRATGKKENYFLIVSTLTPYKKIDLAIQLFNKIGRNLLIVGDGPQRKYLESIASDNITFLGFKDDKTVREYMENCRAFIFPGEEDFGITPVEAMACGKPVLAYAKGGALETVISGKTGEFFFEDNVNSMEDGLARLMYNEKFYKPHTIRRHATQFSREVFEKKILKKCRELAAKNY